MELFKSCTGKCKGDGKLKSNEFCFGTVYSDAFSKVFRMMGIKFNVDHKKPII